MIFIFYFLYICRKLNKIIMKNKYLSIKSLMLITLMSLFSTQSLFAQLPNGSIAPNFELIDLDGTTHKLYEDYTDLGYTVFLDFSAIWCGHVGHITQLTL